VDKLKLKYIKRTHSFKSMQEQRINNVSKRVPKEEIKFSISLSEEQKEAKTQVLDHPFSFIVGKAGSGKTLLAVQIAMDLFFKRKVDKIIITRPTVGTEDNGFLPGSEAEKMDPWLVPIRDNMRKVYNHPEKLKIMETKKDIELVSLTHFRGRTFENAAVIVDEFQNLTKQQLSMAIGRLGKNSWMMFCGDTQQIDLKYQNDSAIHEIAKLRTSEFVYEIKLRDNHRHAAIDELLNLLMNTY
jgi:phosphate starvation-inducible PhoH-like protein